MTVMIFWLQNNSQFNFNELKSDQTWQEKLFSNKK